MTILLTGASGFIGSHVLPLLLAGGHTVWALARNPVTTPPSAGAGRVLTVLGDLSTGTGFANVPWSELDAVVHLAASGVKASNRVWAESVALNIVGTQRLLLEIKRRASRRPKVFIARTFYEQTCAQTPALLENPYIATKLASSELSIEWAKDYDGGVVMGTFFQVYGPRDYAGNVLSYAAGELRQGRPAFFGSGLGMRDWIYVSDAAEAVVRALDEHHTGLRTIDIGSGALTSIKEVVLLLANILNSPETRLNFDPSRDRPDVGIMLAAKNFLGDWRPAISLEVGLAKLASFQEQELV